MSYIRIWDGLGPGVRGNEVYGWEDEKGIGGGKRRKGVGSGREGKGKGG